ncbi:uncharacterized protein LOC132758000 isoform X1 [Ruditapes philippinarum]|uniref:uncharacterized protein LOC132758000 isoform X1 n=1 Tax=Ruditapes philippinarum TaxID=129788 RepID=UPI00295AC1A9|nr:uncharacterized protein LOC132758000 isoform X1 [Ruditapes philippinarum]
MDLHKKADIFLIITVGLLSVTGASICETNKDANAFIGGNNIDVTNNFLHLLREKKGFLIAGDQNNHEDGCRKEMQRFLHQKGHFENGTMWRLDCWDPVECDFVAGEWKDVYTIRAAPKNNLLSFFRMRPKAVLLPIDGHNRVSYTFLPYVQRTSSIFVTSMLSGCSVFVATADNEYCNIIVMHANRFKGHNEPKDDDDNHKQAMFVLEKVNLLTEQCNYQIQRRWSSDHKRSNIERHDYNYPVVYYRLNAGYNFIYSYNLGGQHSRWQFCVKELHPSPQPEICSQIN